MINTQPEICNICGGKVIYTSNAKVYHGKEYGSGYCYLCLKCGAYVGTHVPRPREALGLLADASMRKGKRLCHGLFDPMWNNAENPRQRRTELYGWLAKEMGIPVEECHFGHFDIHQLRQAYLILKKASGSNAA